MAVQGGKDGAPALDCRVAALDRPLGRCVPLEFGSTGPRDPPGPRERDIVFRQNDLADAVYAIVGCAWPGSCARVTWPTCWAPRPAASSRC